MWHGGIRKLQIRCITALWEQRNLGVNLTQFTGNTVKIIDVALVVKVTLRIFRIDIASPIILPGRKTPQVGTHNLTFGGIIVGLRFRRHDEHGVCCRLCYFHAAV